ncbi:S8 family peptidase [Aquabacterium sp.]|uniref:S8 family peptidase n=1 Tax=Aquabacterium sp. TaxID=1872578 RepID=UPI0035AF4466
MIDLNRSWRAARLAPLLLVAMLTQQAAQADTTTTARVIVKLKSSSTLLQDSSSNATVASTSSTTSTAHRMQALGKRQGLTVKDGRQIGPRLQVATATGMSSATLASKLAADADVEYAVVDQRQRISTTSTPDDTLYGTGQVSPYPTAGQWYAHASDSTLVSAINAPTAWALTNGSSDVVVAVVDTGVRFDHADLSGKLLSGYNMISSAAMAGNSVGRSSDASDLGDYLTQAEIDADPADFTVDGKPCAVAASSSWHGTQVSGIIGAATNNSLGIAGIGWNVKILPVRALGKCGGYDSDIIAAMLWAAGISVSGVPTNTTPAKVINLSLGSTGSCTSAYKDAITQITSAGAVIVAAAGNSGTSSLATPANCSGVIAVTALRHVGTKAAYSNYGSSATISAPGGNCVNSVGSCDYTIMSTTNSGTTDPVSDSSGGSTYTNATDYAVGTSFSAPMVSATAALMFSVNSALTPAQIKSLLGSSARSYPTSGGTAGISTCSSLSSSNEVECYCTTGTCGAGMLDTGAAVTAASTYSSSSGSSSSGSSSSSSGGGGGGSLDAGMLALLTLAMAGAARRRRH